VFGAVDVVLVAEDAVDEVWLAIMVVEVGAAGMDVWGLPDTHSWPGNFRQLDRA